MGKHVNLVDSQIPRCIVYHKQFCPKCRAVLKNTVCYLIYQPIKKGRNAFNLSLVQIKRSTAFYLLFFYHLPLTPKSDQPLISPYNITPESHIIQPIRIKRIKKFSIFVWILLVSILVNVQQTAWRICRLKTTYRPPHHRSSRQKICFSSFISAPLFSELRLKKKKNKKFELGLK